MTLRFTAPYSNASLSSSDPGLGSTSALGSMACTHSTDFTIKTQHKSTEPFSITEHAVVHSSSDNDPVVPVASTRMKETTTTIYVTASESRTAMQSSSVNMVSQSMCPDFPNICSSLPTSPIVTFSAIADTTILPAIATSYEPKSPAATSHQTSPSFSTVMSSIDSSEQTFSNSVEASTVSAPFIFSRPTPFVISVEGHTSSGTSATTDLKASSPSYQTVSQPSLSSTNSGTAQASGLTSLPPSTMTQSLPSNATSLQSMPVFSWDPISSTPGANSDAGLTSITLGTQDSASWASETSWIASMLQNSGFATASIPNEWLQQPSSIKSPTSTDKQPSTSLLSPSLTQSPMDSARATPTETSPSQVSGITSSPTKGTTDGGSSSSSTATTTNSKLASAASTRLNKEGTLRFMISGLLVAMCLG